MQKREKELHKLIQEKGEIGTAQYCQEKINEKRYQIKTMMYYDREKISDLETIIMDWTVNLKIINKILKGK